MGLADHPRPPKPESTVKKFFRKFQENPFVIPAFGVTVYALGSMLRAMMKRDITEFNKGQQFRMRAQMAAIFVIAGGAAWQQYQKNLSSATESPSE